MTTTGLNWANLSATRTLPPAASAELLGVPLSSLPLDATMELVTEWAFGDSTRCVTFANAHMLALASQDVEFHALLRSMDLNCIDGRPLAWLTDSPDSATPLRTVCGPDFLPAFMAHTQHLPLRHFFFGAGPGVAQQVAAHFVAAHPALLVAGSDSPPFTEFSEQEMLRQVELINASGAELLWVSLGCPKQERWMHANRHRLRVKVVLAVGQAFDVVAGRVRRAPIAAQRAGLEWLYRLLQSPRRLASRYAVYNTIFLWAVFLQRILREAPVAETRASGNATLLPKPARPVTAEPKLKSAA